MRTVSILRRTAGNPAARWSAVENPASWMRLFADWLRGPPRKLGFNDPRYLITNKTPVTESSTSIVYASASEG